MSLLFKAVALLLALSLSPGAWSANDFYSHSSGVPAAGSQGSSSSMRSEFDAVAAGFAKLPTLTGNGDETVVINSGGTAIASKTAAEMRTLLAVQPSDATLTSIALLGTAADKGLYTTGVDTWAEFALTAAGRAILDDADATAQRATLGLGSMATQASGAISVTGGSMSGVSITATGAALTMPTIGAATATSINKVAVTEPATSATLALDNGSTLATSGANSVTLTSTGATDVTLPTSGTLATIITGSYSATLTGMTTSPIITINYTKVGTIVILTSAGGGATSNATTFTLTGAPAEIRPLSINNMTATNHVEDNGTLYAGEMSMSQLGTISIKLGVGGFANFTTSGTKGIGKFTMMYDTAY